MLTDPIEMLPDQLQDNLRLVFVGTAASKRAAADRHYYAHPGNRFWSTIHEVGITSRRYEPREFADLLTAGIGFTDLCKSDAGTDREIADHSIDVPAFRTKMLKYRPRTIAFTSKQAASFFYKKPTRLIELGRQQSEDENFPQIFVLPSTSGLASSHWTTRPWHELSNWIAAL